jgi:hypothetical protein
MKERDTYTGETQFLANAGTTNFQARIAIANLDTIVRKTKRSQIFSIERGSCQRILLLLNTLSQLVFERAI